MTDSLDDFLSKTKNAYDSLSWGTPEVVDSVFDVHLRSKTIRNRDVFTEYIARNTNSTMPKYNVVVTAELEKFNSESKGLLEVVGNPRTNSVSFTRSTPEDYDYNCVRHFIDLMYEKLVENAKTSRLNIEEY